MVTLTYQGQAFWCIEQHETELHLRWGEIGSQGQHHIKTFASRNDATLKKETLIKEKQQQGYVIKKEDARTSAKKSEHKCPPWLLDTDTIPFPTSFMKGVQGRYVSPSHSNQHYNPLTKEESLRAISKIISDRHWEIEVNISQLSKEDQKLCAAVTQLIQENRLPDIPSLAGVIVTRTILDMCYLQHIAENFMDAIVHGYGLDYAISFIVLYQKIAYKRNFISNRRPSICHFDFLYENSIPKDERNYHISPFEKRLRHHLVHAEEAVWQRCTLNLINALPQMPCWRRPYIAFLLPEHPELADQILQQANGDPEMASLEWLKLSATTPATLQSIDQHCKLHIFELNSPSTELITLLVEKGLPALERLAPYKDSDSINSVVKEINHPNALMRLFNTGHLSRQHLDQTEKAFKRFPHAAVAAAAELLATKEDAFLLLQLQQSLYLQPHISAEVLPWISSQAADIIHAHKTPPAPPENSASSEMLPAILVSPPWQSGKKKAAIPVLTLEVLPIAPIEGPMPPLTYMEEERLGYVKKKTLPEIISRLGFPRDQPDIIAQAIEAYKQKDYERFKSLYLSALPPKPSSYQRNWRLEYLTLLPEEEAIPLWTVLANEPHNGVHTVMHKFGLAAWEGFLTSLEHQQRQGIPLLHVFGAVELALWFARALSDLKSHRQTARQWLLEYPEHAIRGLLPKALGPAGDEQRWARYALTMLAASGQTPLIHHIAALYDQPQVVQALEALLAIDPLDSFPAKRPSLPEFYLLALKHRPCLHNGQVLPDQAMQYLGSMIRFPTTAGIYPGIQHVKEACTSESLACFAWELFSTWLTLGAPTRDAWAFSVLGLFGNDDTARRLTPMIRAWPGEAQHKRAVMGLDILAQIGTDIALMQLNGIAQKLKFKKLREKANEKITQIAEARDLTVSELEDRLAPDLGLDANGSLTLDFGPRQFTVSFDEALKPFIRDAQGSRRKDLPRPSKSDDPTLSATAISNYKALKKDARAIASQQIKRLESAMCQRRRWTHEQFRQFLVEHPLVGHLTRRLVWATYDTNNQLTHCFRVAEDNSYSTTDDDEFIMPDDTAMIGLPHRLEIPDQDIIAFGQLFTDYELISPFSQLDRPCYRLTPEERNAQLLQRWQERRCLSVRLANMSNKGWLRGEPQDAGWIHWLLKPMGEWTAMLEMSKGFGSDTSPSEFDTEQHVTSIGLWKGSAHTYRGWWDPQDSHHSFNEIDEITLSELLSDIEALFA